MVDHSLRSVFFTDIDNGWVCGAGGSILIQCRSYQLSVDCNVSLMVYDITGKRLRKILNEYQIRGEHLARLDLSGLPSGIYLYKFVAGKQVSSGKMVVK